MPKSDNQKLKILYILDYLQKNSHQDHPVRTSELLSMLEEHDIVCDRKTVYSDIAALQAHDLRYGTEYLKTLAAYLDVMCNSVAAANKLHIHKNTLLYRINKLAETFHIDLTKGDMVMKYQLSLQVLDVMARAADVPKSERDAVFKQFR